MQHPDVVGTASLGPLQETRQQWADLQAVEHAKSLEDWAARHIDDPV